MSKKVSNEKLKLNPIRIILLFIGVFFVFEAIFYFTFQGVNGHLWPFDSSFYFYTPALVGISILFCVLSITQTYYQVDRTAITHVKMGKVFKYNFSDIIYINEVWSEKHKTLLFYMRDGKDRYLAFDKEGVIYEYALEYSHLISEEEFRERFPKAKL